MQGLTYIAKPASGKYIKTFGMIKKILILVIIQKIVNSMIKVIKKLLANSKMKL